MESRFAHTSRDTLDQVDTAKLAETVLALLDLVKQL
jgi:hypothetical protein